MIGPVQSKATFSAFRSAGLRVRSGSLQMIFTRVEVAPVDTSVQLAFALNRKFGNAVQRNRARRRIRESFIQVCSGVVELPPGSAFLLLAKPSINQEPFPQLLDSTKHCFDVLDKKGAFSQ